MSRICTAATLVTLLLAQLQLARDLGVRLPVVEAGSP
jgi:hypothetical protein